LMASPWMPRAGVVGGALGALTFCVTVSILAALPIWDAGWGGLPALNGLGSFLIKDVALLGISLEVFGECAGRLQESAANAADARVDAFKRSTHDDHS
jgi:uncharacterized membrane protein YkgB